MKEQILQRITELFGNPNEANPFSEGVEVKYQKHNMYELSFEVTERGLQLFLNGTGPIIGDCTLRDLEDLDQLLEEICVIVSNPIKEVKYMVSKNIRKTRFEYKALLGGEIVDLSYSGGRFQWRDLLKKKEVEKVIYDSWLNEYEGN